MQSRPSVFFKLIILLVLVPVIYAQSSETSGGFTLQVASFPDRDLAEKYINRLTAAGELPVWGTVELPGRGDWTRVFIGSFKTVETARRYGTALMDRGVIEDFIVKPERDTKLLSRPRSVTRQNLRGSRPGNPTISVNGSEIEKRATEQKKALPLPKK